MNVSTKNIVRGTHGKIQSREIWTPNGYVRNTYVYDDSGRLTKVFEDDKFIEQYTYDRKGRRKYD